ncbi:hypothetical protein BVX94_02795 [bacterium B17]|nr:hypothetical protein BVX94_02795 [bacterium B17]
MELKKYLEDKCKFVDEQIDRFMPSEDITPETIHKAMRYSVFSGGKRLRPILCLAAAEACGAGPKTAIEPAVAVELLHTYTLIHDDLPSMDNDDTRRGKPTSHIVFGEANAILAGDALQTLAFQVLAQAPESASPAALVAELSSAAGSLGVVGGQVVDIETKNSTLNLETLNFIHQHKTADLFKASIRMGCIAAGADEQILKVMTSFADNLGLAFQIKDDILDAEDQDKPADDSQDLSCLAVWNKKTAESKANTLVDLGINMIRGLPSERTEPLIEIARYLVARNH